MRNNASLPYTSRPATLLDEVEKLLPPARRALTSRLRLLVTTLTGDEADPTPLPVDLVADVVGNAPDRLWLAHAVLSAELPTDEDMADLLVRARLGGTWAALAPALRLLTEARRLVEVDVLEEVVSCDVHTTSESEFMSGIQRVVRETTARWERAHDVVHLGWTNDQSALRHLGVEQRTRLFGAAQNAAATSTAPRVVVPWRSTHLWVEVITDLRRTGRLLALAQHSGNQVGVLGYDSIPVTSSATVADGMTSHFARSLAGTRRAHRVAMISDAAAEEFRGVMDMGAGRRDRGPEVVSVPLAVAALSTTAEDIAEARAGLVLDDVPMVLVVGSHEPRKNHLAVLHAAELLWREGVRFNLVLVGAGAWNATEYESAVASLLAAGRPVQSIRGLPDRLLWAAYRLAHCTLFPSLNEGFGLPVAESLAAGTPVVTSDFGSMRDIVAPYGEPLGGLLIDPRDDRSLTDGLRTVLTDPTTYARLKAETAQHPERTWDEYAAELWSFLVDGRTPATRGDTTHAP